SIQSIQATGGQMTIVGSATWSGILPGETVELHGLVDSGSSTQYLQYEGGYKVLSLSTTTLIVACPNVADFALINCGGTVFKRTDFRLHLFRSLDYTRTTVEVDGSVGNTN
ncbi:TPA: hypothetical protein REU56_002949, partial [Listeria monocytogenes]|nr:hypothetical protein [Listeria monocytogenes]